MQSDIDNLIITDLHPAGETPIPGITGKQFAQAIKARLPRFSVSYAPLEEDFIAIKATLATYAQPDDLILLLGAGKINRLIHYLL